LDQNPERAAQSLFEFQRQSSPTNTYQHQLIFVITTY
jgi:hypothetical protein